MDTPLIGATPAQLSSQTVEMHTIEFKNFLKRGGGNVSSEWSPVADRGVDSTRPNKTGG